MNVSWIVVFQVNHGCTCARKIFEIFSGAEFRFVLTPRSGQRKEGGEAQNLPGGGIPSRAVSQRCAGHPKRGFSKWPVLGVPWVVVRRCSIRRPGGWRLVNSLPIFGSRNKGTATTTSPSECRSGGRRPKGCAGLGGGVPLLFEWHHSICFSRGQKYIFEQNIANVSRSFTQTLAWQ